MKRSVWDRRLSSLISKWKREIVDPNADPMRVGELLYRIAGHEARMNSVRMSRFANASSGIKTRDIQDKDFLYYLAQSIERNSPKEDRILRWKIDQALGIGRKSVPYIPTALIEEGRRQNEVLDSFRERLFAARQQMYADNLRPIYIGDDDDLQYALGADTGVHDDFDYLRKRERRERVERANQYLREKRARRKGEETIAHHHAELNYQRHLIDMTPRERERHALIMKYGGGAEGIALADYEISKTRGEKAESLRRRRRLDEAREEQDLRLSMPMSMKITHKLLKKIGINTGDSAKDLRKFAKQQKAIESIPVVGKYLASSPIAAGVAVAGAVIKTISAFTEQADSSNEKYIDWVNAQGMYGYAGDRFSKAAYAAGIKDPGAIAKLYGKLTMQYGDAETAFDMFGSMFAGMSGREKSIVAQNLGFTPEMVAMMDLMAGNVKINENRRINAQKNMADVGAVLASTSDQSLLNKAMVMFGSTSVAARMGEIDFSSVARAREISAVDMQSSLLQAGNTTRNVNVSVNVGSVQANDPNELAERTIGEGSEAYRAVVESEDGRSY